MIEGHGDDAWKYKIPLKADFSSNIWYGDLDPGLQAHLQNTITSITHYPEAGAQTVQTEAAAAYGVEPEQVLVTNGATEAIYLAAQAFGPPAQAFGPSTATILIPAFAEYEDACRLYGYDIHRMPLDQLTPATAFHTDLVFLCNPNNPTGAALPITLLQQLIHDNPETIFIVDESYIEFTRATQSLIPFLAAHPNGLVLRSLTKSCRIPGLRIGFAIGHPDLVNRLRYAKMPWSVNQTALEAALYIFRHPQPFTLPLDPLLEATAAWRHQLQLATEWRIHETDTHYFLMETPQNISAGALKMHLQARHGLLIRDASNFPGLTPYHFRVACQSPAANHLLTHALQQCIRTGI